MAPQALLPESITLDEFNEKTLAELDEFRYGEAVGSFSSQKPKRTMNHEDVKTLVDWKLRHGKFRPTLMKLVSSNDADSVQETISGAIKSYWADPNPSKALDGICKLKGVGPATASLLLSVHDPERVIFFSDEAFYWLCCKGQKSPIKYNAKEYQELNKVAQAVVKRLGVSATDVEKVAYVMMKQGDGHSLSSKREKDLPTDVQPTEASRLGKPSKRKEKPERQDTSDPSLRRSKHVGLHSTVNRRGASVWKMNNSVWCKAVVNNSKCQMEAQYPDAVTFCRPE
ncbi:hypothetical protein JX265_005946 [Neoarthrinium moseri]|uniref:Uncharacterized protein n=1 Tax=Neoarthrinium moseri TaxID=1658444 RepID=A0A9P9WM53_9PEZI|nr:hypothetical protein JX266_002962 [Neoarthrinium moseri]KAI1870906.1 hypothetical protein JX265_005946 [Neoarthrinium moseri]